MNKSTIQYKILGFLMLMVFTLSIMPRQLLHDVVTNHVHKASLFNTGEDTVSRVNFLCDAAGEVVKSPFTVFDPALDFQTIEQVQILNFRLLSFLYADSKQTVLLRGPPSLSIS